MLLIGNSGVGKSCLLVRYAVSTHILCKNIIINFHFTSYRKTLSTRTSSIPLELISKLKQSKWMDKALSYRSGILLVKRDSEL